MKVNLLNEGYKKSTEFYHSFLNDSIEADGFLSDDSILVPYIEPFPIHFGNYKEKDDPSTFFDLIIFFKKHFIHLNMDIYMNELFLHSLITTKMREYILEKYPKIKNKQSIFEIVVTRNLNWENYLYKAAIIAKYVNDNIDQSEQLNYINLILDNLDVFNHIIKSKIFRNNDFFIKFFNVIKKNNLSSILNAQIKNKENPEDDLRVGRMILIEFSNAYPVLLSPLLPQDEFELYFKKFLNYYY